ncbi:hypothetical protein F5877DRAFT_72784 [Lentinula edodes]|nr:hypothetical protein F5877DRAFT_72784 [Lentinula edodes]
MGESHIAYGIVAHSTETYQIQILICPVETQSATQCPAKAQVRHTAATPMANSSSAWHHPIHQQPEVHLPLQQISTSLPYNLNVETPSHNDASSYSHPPTPAPTSFSSQTAQLFTASTSSPTNPSTSSNSQDSHSTPMSIFSTTWAIWSRRPTDPNLAPGLVFSSCIQPPDYIVRDALDIRTPPASPTKEATPLPGLESQQTQEDVEWAVTDCVPEPAVVLLLAASVASSEEASTTATATPSTTLPGSPASSTTSISVSAPAGSFKDTSSEYTEAPTSLELALISDVAAIPRIPTSSIVGFSVPADPIGSSQGGGQAIPTGERAELLALLSSDVQPPSYSGPASSGISYAAILISKPAGLINTGNMCFANSVLPLLTYSPPFFCLFPELGRIGAEDVKLTSGVHVPLVDATIEFQRSFKDRKAKLEEENKSKGKERSMTPQPEDDLCPFLPTGIYDASKTKKQFDSMRGGQQEDVEEFLGFYLEGLEEELTMLTETLTHGESGTVLEGKNKRRELLR